MNHRDTEMRRMKATGGGITKEQMRKVYAVVRELGWGYDDLHRWMDASMGNRHLTEMSRSEVGRLIDRLGRMLTTDKHGRPRTDMDRKWGQRNRAYRECGVGVDEKGNVVEYCTKAQLAKMRAVAGRLDWGDAWIEKVASRTLGRSITGLCNMRFKEAMRVINVVEGLVMEREKRNRSKPGNLFGEDNRQDGLKAEELKGSKEGTGI